MPLTEHEEGSQIELEEIDDNQRNSGLVVECVSTVPDQSKTYAQDLNERNDEESAGVTETGQSQSYRDEKENIGIRRG